MYRQLYPNSGARTTKNAFNENGILNQVESAESFGAPKNLAAAFSPDYGTAGSPRRSLLNKNGILVGTQGMNQA